MILVEPDALLTHASRMPGLDGQKMSKSYGNTITMREDADSITKKIRNWSRTSLPTAAKRRASWRRKPCATYAKR